MTDHRSIGAVVRAQAAATPEREVLVHRDARWTWAQLDAEADRWAAMLRAAGVASGDRVAVAGRPEPRFLFALLGCARIGAVYQGLDPKHRAEELRYVLGDSEPCIVLDPADLLADVELAVRRLAGRELLDALAAAQSVPAEQLDAVDPRSPVAIVYTSGSTGKPKGALIAHEAFVRTAEIQTARWFVTEAPSMLCNLPINHVGAIGNICASVLVAGGRLVFQERFDADEVLELIARERIDHWAAVPTMLQLSVASERWDDADLSSVRAVLWSGGAAPLQLVAELRRRFGALRMSYGSTETIGEVCFADPDADDDVLAHTIGRPASEYEVRLATPDGGTCAAGEPGELVVRGICQALGYWRNPAATAELLDADGWLHTGDVAVERPDGNLELVGRTREMYKSGGYNVYPREVELAIEEHPGVEVAAVVALADELYGEIGHAWVQAPASAVDAEALQEHLRARLANYKVPKHVTVVEELPLLSIGKVDKHALRARASRPAG
ncbi:MAG TPA: class I adenylate-forming enzyme family protein [Conexibacter sp.]|jgi:acyl-CoA synthetase (AMP-forming)/AMP-acid ligase II|nr:class I adenylate-forming enzyme family protein [Conexibacter sp.]